MATPKKPQDHKPKAPQAEKIQITIGDGGDARTVPGRRVTVRDVTVEVADEVMDDFEVLDQLNKIEGDNNPAAFAGLLRALVGDEFRRVLDELRDPVTGRVKVETGIEFVMELFQALDPNS